MVPISKGDSYIIQGVQGALGPGREEWTYGAGDQGAVNKFKGLFYWFFFHGRQCDPPLCLFPETCSGIYITHWHVGKEDCAWRGLTRCEPGVERQTQGENRLWIRSPGPCVTPGHTCSLYLRAPPGTCQVSPNICEGSKRPAWYTGFVNQTCQGSVPVLVAISGVSGLLKTGITNYK